MGGAPSAATVARSAIERLTAQVPAARRADARSPGSLHELRIEAKKLRYTLETCAQVVPGDTAPAIEALTEVQDHLGDWHDAVLAIEFAEEALEQ